MDKTDAVVLRVVEYSETSLVVTLYTRQFGKLAAIAKGARRPKSPFEGALDLLSVCDVVLIRKPADQLAILTEAKLVRRFRGGENQAWSRSARLARLHGAYYLVELLRRLVEDGQGQENLFELLLATIARIEGRADLLATILYFEVQALKLLGHAPRTQSCVCCGRWRSAGDPALPSALHATEETAQHPGKQRKRLCITSASSVSEAADVFRTTAPNNFLNSKKQITFGLLSIGVLCDTCTPSERNAMLIRPETLALLDRFMQANGPLPDSEIQGAIVELRSLIRRILEGLLGQSLRLGCYVPVALQQ